MKTQLFSKQELDKAAVILKNGGTVAFPTETVYGLGANALDPEAVKKIFKAKGRPGDNPLIVHIADIDQLKPLVKEVPPKAQKLIEAFWPGPLTLIMERSEMIPDEVSAGLSTVGIRMPRDPIAREFLRKSALPVAAPSANRSGKPSTTSIEATLEDLKDRVDAIVVSEPSEVGIESTVIDMTKETPIILRPGLIHQGMIEEVIGEVKLSEGITTGIVPEKPASPGMKYTHYSPMAKVVLIKGNKQTVHEKILKIYQEEPEEQLGLFVLNGKEEDYPKSQFFLSFPDILTLAKEIYQSLREADKQEVSKILIEMPEINDQNLYVIDRLLHASGYTVI